MICIYESVCHNLAHTPFNAAIVEMAANAFPDESICFLGSGGHIAELKALLGPRRFTGIQWIPIENLSAASPFRRLRLLFPHLSGVRRLILTSTDSEFLFLLKLALLGKNIRCLAVLHSQLAGVGGWRSRNPMARLWDLEGALGLKVSWGKFHYLVLERGIQDRLIGHLPKLGHRVSTLVHPVPRQRNESPLVSRVPPFRFGFLGVASQGKGFDGFLNLAKWAGRRTGVPLEFHAIGRHSPESRKMDLSPLCSRPSEDHLARNDFIEQASTMHFLCFPYDGHRYEYVASGALMDAIALEIPIMALPFPAVEALDGTYGSIGYFFDSVEEMVDGIVAWAGAPEWEKYLEQRQHLKLIRQDRSTGALVPEFRRIACRAFG
ncbi:MAG: hypothetical protein MI747_02920 [Desulfobacterales bacterium]|nr:hypothetical protein [Desulfobacterales bacterium]